MPLTSSIFFLIPLAARLKNKDLLNNFFFPHTAFFSLARIFWVGIPKFRLEKRTYPSHILPGMYPERIELRSFWHSCILLWMDPPLRIARRRNVHHKFKKRGMHKTGPVLTICILTLSTKWLQTSLGYLPVPVLHVMLYLDLIGLGCREWGYQSHLRPRPFPLNGV